jgi:hypothetical protein
MNTSRYTPPAAARHRAGPLPAFMAGLWHVNGMFGYVAHGNLWDLAAYVARTQARVLFLFGLS